MSFAWFLKFAGEKVGKGAGKNIWSISPETRFSPVTAYLQGQCLNPRSVSPTDRSFGASGKDDFGCWRVLYLIRLSGITGFSFLLCTCGFGLQSLSLEELQYGTSCFQSCLLFVIGTKRCI